MNQLRFCIWVYLAHPLLLRVYLRHHVLCKLVLSIEHVTRAQITNRYSGYIQNILYSQLIAYHFVFLQGCLIIRVGEQNIRLVLCETGMLLY